MKRKQISELNIPGATGSSDSEIDFGLTGPRSDAYINLTEMGARWYDPVIGRWISPDSIIPEPGNPQALNRYSYAYNSPVRFIDPNGHAPIVGEDEDGNPTVDREEAARQRQLYFDYLADLERYMEWYPQLGSVDDLWELDATQRMILMIWGEGRDLYYEGNPQYGDWDYVRRANAVAAWSVRTRQRVHPEKTERDILLEGTTSRKNAGQREIEDWAYRAFGDPCILAPRECKTNVYDEYWTLAVEAAVGMKYGKIPDPTNGEGYYFHDEPTSVTDPISGESRQLATRYYRFRDDQPWIVFSRP